MKILLVGRNCKVGGGCSFRLRVARGLMARGHCVELAAQGGPMAPAFEKLGVRVHKIWPTPFNRLALARILRHGGYDVIHADTPTAGDDIAAVWEKMHTPRPKFVVAVHGLIPETAPNPSLRRCDRLICFDASALQRLRKINGLETRPVDVVERPVELKTPSLDAQSLETRERVPQIVLVARLSQTKGQVALAILEAFALLQDRFAGLEFLVVGEGSLRANTEATARQINAQIGREAVKLVGQKLDPMPFITRASVVVGGGLVAMEALCHGVPVVASGFQHWGVVRGESLSQAVGCNFGDSLLHQNPPTSAALTQDLSFALTHFQTPQGAQELKQMTLLMRQNHSIENCTQRLEAVYLT